MDRLTWTGEAKNQERIGPIKYLSPKILAQWENRLAAYEDTGLEPEICAEYKKFEDELVASGITFKRVLELVQADKEGRSVMLPCKVGDTVYRLYTDGIGNIDDSEICEDTIYEFYFNDKGLGISIGPYDGHIGNYTNDGCDTGVWKMFLAREAAEAAMGKEQDDA